MANRLMRGTNQAVRRLVAMRFFYVFLLSSVLILAAGCSAPQTATAVAVSPQATVGVYPGGSLGTGLDPVTVGRQHLEAGGALRWLESPTPVFVQEVSYAGARKLIPVLDADDAQNQLWAPETRVWLVVFKGRWQLLPYGQTQGTPQPSIYDGCALVLFTASDGSLIIRGDTACPGQP